ncbi:selenocysteine-specific translation elongation factor [Herbidospora sp. NBRC 101105]|uniref:selenocysteine-specific translation elongation factor n=1 Tax=Herbidospora sp. NBRC 101105 TaxID=3032195 RepID=UPI0024A3D807|nr:selenocysteine-specific translation elongation factor [Herbidospora sp. NBRC 101105]GLX99052.1 selenocysteine-specific translation elongation factor [Herbidospora sp. NBRC 101105]
MRVIATAGHVDHGKSTLLRALTGMEPDRWEEERRRGLTIDLGYVWTEDLTFVDVPGHERFVGNMLAGVGPVTAVLFVVAADSGWAVQSQEHLEILHALGVGRGVLAVTRSDLADPEPVLADCRERLRGTTLADVPSIAVSAVTGHGLPGLRALLASIPMAGPDPEADVRLWIDRVFTVEGRGTVVTGTLGAGVIRVGDVLRLGGDEVRVRGLHSLNEAKAEVAAPARVAVNLRGGARPRRGDTLVTPGRWLDVGVLDIRVSGEGCPPDHVTWHFGTAAEPARLRALGDGAARVTLPRPLPLRVGDRALLRDPGSRRVWGAVVLDVRPPELRRRGAAKARAAELAGMSGRPDGAAELRRRGLARRGDLAAMGTPVTAEPVAGDWVADPAHWAGLRTRLTEAVAAQPGIPAETARRLLDLSDRSLVDALAEGTPIRLVRGRLVLPARTPGVAELRRAWADDPFTAPDAARLAELGLDARALAAAEAAGELVRLAPGVVLPPEAPEEAAAVLARLPRPFTVAQARTVLNTSRRVVVPLLEHLDRLGVTRRQDASGSRTFL